jgi:hypothetical protein
MARVWSNRRAAAVVAVSFAALAALGAGTAQGSTTKIGWGKCYGQFQCGTLQVPLDYAKPNGTTISLAVVRLPATDPAHRIGSLFLNPGGPGGSGSTRAASREAPRCVASAATSSGARRSTTSPSR